MASTKAVAVLPPDDEPPRDAPPDKSQKATTASEWGKERRERRREWRDVKEKEFDKRHTRTAKFKLKKVTAWIRPEAYAAMDAYRSRMGYGRGMSWGELFEYLFGRMTKKASKEWMAEHDEGDPR
jgi:hypothetical protein